MPIRTEFETLIKLSMLRHTERREVVPISFAHQALFELVKDGYPTSEIKQHEFMAKYSPIAEWFAAPKTIEEFVTLKDELMSLAWVKDFLDLQLLINDQLLSYENAEPTPIQRKIIEWKHSIAWVLSIAEKLKIVDWERIEAAKINPYDQTLSSHELMEMIEGSTATISEFPQVHKNLNRLVAEINGAKHHRHEKYWISRVGLIIGDFRVGDHSAHGRFIERAKKAVGKHGQLIVIAPSKETILHTTTKTQVWSDQEREYRLSANRYIDHVFIADMPEKFYSNPDVYWRMIWQAIAPDIVFLGEANHPLEEKYRQQSQYLGGILLIDEEPVTRRSDDLVHIV